MKIHSLVALLLLAAVPWLGSCGGATDDDGDDPMTGDAFSATIANAGGSADAITRVRAVSVDTGEVFDEVVMIEPGSSQYFVLPGGGLHHAYVEFASGYLAGVQAAVPRHTDETYVRVYGDASGHPLDLDGTWRGTMRDGGGGLHTLSVSVSGDTLSALEIDGAAVPMWTATIDARMASGAYLFTDSAGLRGGFLLALATDAESTAFPVSPPMHAAFLDASGVVGVLQRGATGSGGVFTSVDVQGAWRGTGFELSGPAPDLAALEVGTLSVSTGGDFDGAEAFSGLTYGATGALVLDDPVHGLYVGAFSASDGASGELHVLLSEDRQAAALVSVVGSSPVYPDDYRFFIAPRIAAGEPTGVLSGSEAVCIEYVGGGASPGGPCEEVGASHLAGGTAGQTFRVEFSWGGAGQAVVAADGTATVEYLLPGPCPLPDASVAGQVTHFIGTHVLDTRTVVTGQSDPDCGDGGGGGSGPPPPPPAGGG